MRAMILAEAVRRSESLKLWSIERCILVIPVMSTDEVFRKGAMVVGVLLGEVVALPEFNFMVGFPSYALAQGDRREVRRAIEKTVVENNR